MRRLQIEGDAVSAGTQEHERINSSQPVPRCYLPQVGGRQFCNAPHMASLVGASDTPDMR